MNPKLMPIFSRRSIRKYAPGALAEDDLREILAAAMAAPSACAKDPWRFIVVRDPQRLQALAEIMPHGKMLKDSAAAIVVAGDLVAAHANELSFLLQDCSAAIENLLLAASMLGLGGVWLGVHPREDRIAAVRRLMGLPDEIVPVSIVALGRPGESKDPRTRYHEDYVHFETW